MPTTARAASEDLELEPTERQQLAERVTRCAAGAELSTNAHSQSLIVYSSRKKRT